MLIKNSNQNQIVTEEFMKGLQIENYDKKTQLEKLKKISAKELVEVAYKMAKVRIL